MYVIYLTGKLDMKYTVYGLLSGDMSWWYPGYCEISRGVYRGLNNLKSEPYKNLKFKKI